MFTHKVEIYPNNLFRHDHVCLNLTLGAAILVIWDPPSENLPRALFVDLALAFFLWTVTVTLGWIERR